MLSLQGVAYALPNRDILFSDIDLVVNPHEKLALVGKYRGTLVVVSHDEWFLMEVGVRLDHFL